MIKKITNNLGWKLLSFFLAFLLWLTVVNMEDPIVTTTIRDVPVEKLNENAITSQKQAIQYVAGDTIDVKVKGKRSLAYKLSPSNIRAYANMKNLSITGAVDIEVELPNDVELVSKSPSSVSVTLEKVIRKQVIIQYEKIGKVKAGYVDLSPIITPNVIELEAAESLIYKIEKVVVPVNVEGISGDFTVSIAPQIYDYSGEIVSGIEVSTNQVQVKVPVEKTKNIPIRFEPKGEVGKDYLYLGFKLSQENVSIRGKGKLMDEISELVVRNIDISNMTEKQKVSVNLAKLLPDGINLNQDYSTIDVEVNIEPYIEKDFQFSPDEIEVKDLSNEKVAKILNDQPITVTYRGIKSVIDSLDKNKIKPEISLSEIKEGTHSVMINWIAPNDIEKVSLDNQVAVEIENKEASED